eukprot:SAG31_NODE_1132_length_9746_cov_6.720639_4_plen_120_part_00
MDPDAAADATDASANAAIAWENAFVEWEGTELSGAHRGEAGQPIELHPAMKALLGDDAPKELSWPELYHRTGLMYRLYFAGEAVSYSAAQCVDGAVGTGLLAANCVLCASAVGGKSSQH